MSNTRSNEETNNVYTQKTAQKYEDHGAASLPSPKTPHARQLRFFTNKTSKLDTSPRLGKTLSLRSKPVHEEGGTPHVIVADPHYLM